MACTWREPGDEAAAALPGPTGLPGFGARSELVERYAWRSGRDLSELPYHLAFSRWRIACTLAGVHARYCGGYMGEDGYADEVAGVVEQSQLLLETALRDLRGI